MSNYNYDLQAIAGDLQTILNTVNTLPEVGSGGGSGGGIELCTVEIVSDAPLISDEIYFLDANLTSQKRSVSESEYMMGFTIQCVKNSYVYSNRGNFMDYRDMNTANVIKSNTPYLLILKGDGTFTINV